MKKPTLNSSEPYRAASLTSMMLLGKFTATPTSQGEAIFPYSLSIA